MDFKVFGVDDAYSALFEFMREESTQCDHFTFCRDGKPYGYAYGPSCVAEMALDDFWPIFKTKQEAVDYWDSWLKEIL